MDQVFFASFSPDGMHIVTASADGTARLWAASTGDLNTMLQITEGRILSASFSADGTRIVTVNTERSTQLWNTGDGALIAQLGEASSTAEINFAAFNSAGTRIVTVGCAKFAPRGACLAGAAQVWDANGNLLTTFEGHTNSIDSASFNADGTRLATVSRDGTVRLWAVWSEIDAMLIEAGRRAGRTFTDVECQQYLHRPCP